MSTTYRDYYQVLGVDRGVSQKEIKAAYKKLARKYHPDLHTGKDKQAAEEKFKEINEAHEVLGDPEKRAKYDRLGEHWQDGQQWTPPDRDGFHFYTGGEPGFGTSGFSDFFETMFGGSRRGRHNMRGQDVESELALNLAEAYHGGKKTIQLTAQEACAACYGSGYLDRGACPYCGGTGQTGTEKTLEVKIPAGVRQGSKIRLKGLGRAGGDLYLTVRILPDPTFVLKGDDLESVVTITPDQAVLGDKVTAATMDGPVTVKIPAMSRSGHKLRLRGKGWPIKGNGRGDQYIKLAIDLPAHLSQGEKELYHQLAKLRKGV